VVKANLNTRWRMVVRISQTWNFLENGPSRHWKFDFLGASCHRKFHVDLFVNPMNFRQDLIIISTMFIEELAVKQFSMFRSYRRCLVKNSNFQESRKAL
jgi:hypothetical protein